MTPEADPTLAGRLGMTGLAFALFGMAVCWWYPFGPLVALVGAVLAAAGWLGGDRLGRLGTALAAGGAAAGAVIAWESWARLLGS
jgi:hypothetical protein